MAEKFTIRELELEEYLGKLVFTTQYEGARVRYGVFNECGKMVSMHYCEKYARQMAAVPELQSDLRTALEYIGMLHRSEPSDDSELERILSALKRAKGE